MMRLIEGMERRVLMAADADVVIIDMSPSVTFEDGVLTVLGTPGDDKILVDFPAGQFFEGPPLRVTVNGVTRSFEGRTFNGATMLGTPDLTQVIIRGGAGNDRIIVGRIGIGAELHGDAGNDTIVGGDGADTIDGGAGNDRMKGRGGVDVFTPEPDGTGMQIDYQQQDDVPLEKRVRLRKDGTLIITGTLTADTIEIAEMNDVAVGDQAFVPLDVFFNGEKVTFKREDVNRIVVLGYGGDDGVLVRHGTFYVPTSAPMTIHGGKGADNIQGGSCDDLIVGGAGNDHVFGLAGDDTLVGGGGDDYLRGDDGDDVFAGGPDKDQMIGGAGEDVLARKALTKNPVTRKRID